MARCTPMPRPWISRTSAKPRARASSRYSSTTEGTSRGANACRSSESSMGMGTGESSAAGTSGATVAPIRSEPRSGGQVLRPVLEAREILPRELALSECRRALEEGHVDHRHVLGARGFGHLLRHHLTDERDRDPPETVEHLVRAAQACPRQHGTVGRGGDLVGIVLAGLRHELLQAERDVVRDPGLDAGLGLVESWTRAVELVVQRAQKRLESTQARLEPAQPLAQVTIAHR